MNTQAPFKKELHRYLMQIGYSHVQIVGCLETGVGEEKDISDYFLVALKENDPNKASDDTKLWVEEINSTEVREMLEGEEGINFLIEIPETDFAKFQSSNN